LELNAESRSGLPALGEPSEDADDAISFAGIRIPLDGAAQESNFPPHRNRAPSALRDP